MSPSCLVTVGRFWPRHPVNFSTMKWTTTVSPIVSDLLLQEGPCPMLSLCCLLCPLVLRYSFEFSSHPYSYSSTVVNIYLYFPIQITLKFISLNYLHFPQIQVLFVWLVSPWFPVNSHCLKTNTSNCQEFTTSTRAVKFKIVFLVEPFNSAHNNL